MLDKIIDAAMITFITVITLWVGHYWVTELIRIISEFC